MMLARQNILEVMMKFRLVFACLMSFVMSLLMTAWVTWLNLGWSSVYVTRWLHAFVAAWPAAFLIVVVLAPAVQRLTQKIIQKW